jgi:tetratricopeptide (TPR) repeat protein
MTMAETSHDPEGGPLDELGEGLRRAVEQVRATPAPADGLARALEKARRVPALAYRAGRRRLLLAGGLAAGVCLAVGLWQALAPERHQDIARRDSKIPDRPVITIIQAPPTDLPNKDLGRATDKGHPDGTSNGITVGLGDGSVRDPKDDSRPSSRAPDRPELSYGGMWPPRGSGPGIRPPGRGPGAPGEAVAIRIVRGRHEGRGVEAFPDRNRSRSGKEKGEKDLDPPYLYQDALSDLPEADRLKKKELDERGRSLARRWPALAPAEREKSLRELTKGLKGEARKRVEDYFRDLGKTRPGKGKLPAVWHRDASRPSFARVYVGDGNALELVSLHVSVQVEGPRARTLVDHVFRNPHPRQLEGTFEYPLPSGASPSYYAMFLGHARGPLPPRFRKGGDDRPLPAEALAKLSPEQLVKQVDSADWGKLQEARVVAQPRAAEAYEEVVRRNVDPALLEYAGGNTFRGRVFPIPAEGYTRVVLAYEETLPVVGGKLLYRFGLPGRRLAELRFSLRARSAECKDPVLLPAGAEKAEGAGAVLFTRTWEKARPSGEVMFRCTPADARVQSTSGQHGDSGPHYLYARLRPALPEAAKAEPFARQAVFLLDTSLSEDPDRFAVSMKLLRAILEGDGDIERFNVLTFNAAPAWLEPSGWLPNTRAGREKALARLEGLLLEGATDLSAALDALCRPPFELEKGAPLNCFLLSDGHLTWGETDPAALVAKFARRCPYRARWHCYRTGLGQESAELYDALTRAGGGVFHCYGEADVPAAARAHRRHCLQVRKVSVGGGPKASELLVAGRKAAVYPGGELVVAARCAGAGKAKVVVEGTFRGKELVQEFPVEVSGGGELAGRGWGELAVASLLALNDPRLDDLVTAYCQEFGIASRAASFLVLESEEDYKRFRVDEESRRVFKGDLAQFLEDSWRALARDASPRDAFARLFGLIDARTRVLSGPGGAHVSKLLNLLGEDDFALAEAPLKGALLRPKDVDPAYQLGRRKDRSDVHVYLDEARRRAKAGDADGAVRVLSSVVEEHPGRGDALRLVGYRLLDLGKPAQAARLFARVQRERPYEPHGHRDLARALEECGQYGLAAVHYEAVLAGDWHARFGDALKAVVKEEYARMMQRAVRGKKLGKRLADHFGERLEKMRDPQPASDLRVTISWNTDATDVDLWVIEPDGTKCFFSHNRTKNGGELSADQTQGYGPERYQVKKALPGTYKVVVHYFRPNPNLLGGETHVNVVIARKAGTPDETVERRTVILKRHGEEVEVCKIKF